MLRALREGNVSWQEDSTSGCFAFDRRNSTRPIHTSPITIEQRVPLESPPNRRCPADASWPGLPFLAQERQKYFVAFANRLWRKQVEVSNPVPVSIRDLICKTGDELANGVDCGDSPTQLLIFGQKTDLMVFAGEQPVLGNRRPAQIYSWMVGVAEARRDAGSAREIAQDIVGDAPDKGDDFVVRCLVHDPSVLTVGIMPGCARNARKPACGIQLTVYDTMLYRPRALISLPA